MASWSRGATAVAEAVWFRAPRQVEIREESVPAVGPADVRIRALVSGVSAGSELLVYGGHAPPELQPDLPTIGGDFGLPIKFGYSSVGKVVAVGSGVEQLAVDDLVFVHQITDQTKLHLATEHEE